MGLTYKEAGVDIEKAGQLVAKIKARVQATYGKRVWAGVGGFAGLYKISEQKLLAVGTDGVGTKLLVACELDAHDSIGQDLVAMCVNDILCTGARPLFFLDYYACGELCPTVAERVIGGIARACLLAEMALLGGETAEMPGLYQKGEYDLAGFAVGEVTPENLIDGRHLEEGMAIIGLAASGPHANGWGLIRKILEQAPLEEAEKRKIKSELLAPTEIYSGLVLELLKDKHLIRAMAHITGGGLLNISRVNEAFNYIITTPPEIPPLFQKLMAWGEIALHEAYRTWNMGVGFVLITARPQELLKRLSELGASAFLLGHIEKGQGEVWLQGELLGKDKT